MLDMATETEDPTPSKAKNCVKLKYSASSVIRTSIIRILDYPNPQNNYIHKILMIFIRS